MWWNCISEVLVEVGWWEDKRSCVDRVCVYVMHDSSDATTASAGASRQNHFVYLTGTQTQCRREAEVTQC